jgi:hypothetical protein
MTAPDLAPSPAMAESGSGPRARLPRQHFAGTRGLAVNGGALIANVFASGFTGLLFWVLAARVAEPEVVANGSAMVTAIIAVVSLSQQSFVFTLPSLLAVSPEPRRLAVRTYGAALALTAIAAPVYVLAGPSLASGLDYLRDWHLAVAFVAGACGWCLFSLQDAVLTGVRKGAVVLVENASWGLARLAIVAGLWATGTRLGVGWLVTSWVVPASGLVVVVSWYLFVSDRSPLATPAGTTVFDRRKLASFLGAEYAASVLSSTVQLVAVAYALTRLGAAGAAPLLAASSLVLVVEGAVASFSQALAVEAAKAGGDRSHRRNLVRVTVLFIGGVSVAAVTASALAGHEIMALLGPTYRDTGGTALAILMLCVLPRGIIVVSNADNRIRGEGGRNLLQQAVAAAVFFGLLLTGTVNTVATLAWALVAMRVVTALLALAHLRRGRLRTTSPG